MTGFKRKKIYSIVASLALACVSAFGCQRATTTSEDSPEQTVVERSAGEALPTAAISTGEPENYAATIRISAETTGERKVSLPSLEAEIAKRDDSRRVSFLMPNGERIVYLSRGDTKYMILPDRDKYAEVSGREADFEIPRLLMPDQLVEFIKGQRGYVRAGEEEMNGRAVVKYVATADAQVGARAGNVSAENFVFVDKLTELPLRAEFISEASGAVQGVRGLKVITEMRNVSGDAEESLFNVPSGLEKVRAERVRREVNDLFDTAAGLAVVLLNQMKTAADNTDASEGI